MYRIRLAVALFAGLLTTGCADDQPAIPQPAQEVVVQGSIDVSNCAYGDGPGVGSAVFIFDDGLLTLGSAELSMGSAGECSYDWIIGGVPDNRRYYRVIINGRSYRIAGDEVRRGGWLRFSWDEMTASSG